MLNHFDDDDMMASLAEVDAVLREGGRGVGGALKQSAFDSDEAAIIPFNLSVTEGLSLAHDEDSEEGLFDLTPPVLETLKDECSSYIDNLEHTLINTFSNTNRKLSRRLRETSSIPLSFLYMRSIQAALKQTGHLDLQREKRILFNLQELCEPGE
eukprot:TRINITY_DN18127_c0_g1_i1.p1 TRINITY_DN18127_c0_g1~~TRINITY_DN18127_c0_g1_i1.p1  ORF type:complete len:155 (+),score=34.58 TRINITY_DN18127_c0_g1_i1:104-568(+)